MLSTHATDERTSEGCLHATITLTMYKALVDTTCLIHFPNMTAFPLFWNRMTEVMRKEVGSLTPTSTVDV